MELFAVRGFEAVTIEAICEAADVARATFFLHFPTKASLLHEWNCQVAAEFSATPARAARQRRRRAARPGRAHLRRGCARRPT